MNPEPATSPRIFAAGVGAVSPAGWGMSSFRDALCKQQPLPVQQVVRATGSSPGARSSISAGTRRLAEQEPPLDVRRVPVPSPRPPLLAHPRLRRASPITQHAAAAALEAIGDDLPLVSEGKLRLGIVLTVMSGCVNYTQRFYDETLRDPATASPLIFPETVFNAPASHIAALLGASALNYTLVGDPGTFLQGLAVAAAWLCDDRGDAAVIVAAEEVDPLTADALRLFQKRAIFAAGAGAVYLRRESNSALAELISITDPKLFLRAQSRREAIKKMRAQLGNASAAALLCDSAQGIPFYDADEAAAWSDFSGPRLSPKVVLGEGMIAAAAWQCVAAIDALAAGTAPEALVSVAGCNEQAIGARFLGSRF